MYKDAGIGDWFGYWHFLDFFSKYFHPFGFGRHGVSNELSASREYWIRL